MGLTNALRDRNHLQIDKAVVAKHNSADVLVRLPSVRAWDLISIPAFCLKAFGFVCSPSPRLSKAEAKENFYDAITCEHHAAAKQREVPEIRNVLGRIAGLFWGGQLAGVVSPGYSAPI
jgi:hypothetical protein